MNYKDYYKILGVSKSAKADEIKKAYRKLAQKYHPDKNPGDSEAESTFKDISEAYDVLSDPDKKRKYNNLGSSWSNFRQSGGRSDEFDWSDWASARGRRGAGTHSDPFGGSGNVSDFFEKIFGSGFKQQGRYKQSPKKGNDYQTNLELGLDEAFSGSVRVLNINGEKIKVKLKPGIQDRQSLKISGKGLASKNGGPNGDLLINVTIQEHSKVVRKGNDLHLNLEVDLYRTLLGGTMKISTFAGKVSLKIPPESQSGKILRLSKQGMPVYGKPSKKGDLYITLQVKLPENLSDKEKELFRELRDLKKS